MSGGWVKISPRHRYHIYVSTIVKLGLPHSVAAKANAKNIIPITVWVPKWVKQIMITYMDNESFSENLSFKEYASMVAGDYIDKANNVSTTSQMESS